MRADRADVHCGGEGVRELDGVCDGNKRAAARDGEENGRGCGAESCERRRGGENPCGNEWHGGGCAAGDERESYGDSAGIQSATSGGTGVADGDSDGDGAAGSGERRDFQGRDGAGNLWAANV